MIIYKIVVDEIPKNCSECPLSEIYDYESRTAYCKAIDKETSMIDNCRHRECPLTLEEKNNCGFNFRGDSEILNY